MAEAQIPEKLPEASQTTTTTSTNNATGEESAFKLNWKALRLHLSLRGFVVLSLIATICFLAIEGLDIPEALSTFTGLALGYYFRTNGVK